MLPVGKRQAGELWPRNGSEQRKKWGSCLGTRAPKAHSDSRSFFDRGVGSSILASLSEAGGDVLQKLASKPLPPRAPESAARHLECAHTTPCCTNVAKSGKHPHPETSHSFSTRYERFNEISFFVASAAHFQIGSRVSHSGTCPLNPMRCRQFQNHICAATAGIGGILAIDDSPRIWARVSGISNTARFFSALALARYFARFPGSSIRVTAGTIPSKLFNTIPSCSSTTHSTLYRS